jgi:hypothetical protein
MSQFVHMTGARTMETKWFSISCNVSGGQIGHSLLTTQLAAICQPVRREDKQTAQGEGLNRDKDPLFALLRAYSCQLKRHIAPVYGSVT